MSAKNRFLHFQGAGRREQGGGSREEEAGRRKQGGGSREEGVGSREEGGRFHKVSHHGCSTIGPISCSITDKSSPNCFSRKL